MRKKIIVAFMTVGVLNCLAAAPPVRVGPSDLYRASNLQTIERTRDLAIEARGEPWEFSAEERCNFTFISPEAQEVSFSDQGLSFVCGEDAVVLGWGNYDGRQPREERLLMFSGWNEVELRVRQTAAESTWALELWADGTLQQRGGYGAERLPFWAKPREERKLKGTETQTLRFKVYRPGPDGFGLTLRGPAGNRVTIESVRITQTLNRGFFRKSVNLPSGKIWRAVGEIVRGATLYVNGEEVPLGIPSGFQTSLAVDLAPWLDAGRENVIALFGEQLPGDRRAPQIYFQGRIIMADGATYTVDTGPDWLAHDQEQEGWNRPGFDADTWMPAEAGRPSTTYLTRRWPTYDGRLLLESPGMDPMLYFDAAEPVGVTLRMPAGLQDPDHAVDWTLRKVERYGKRRGAAQGTATDVRAGGEDSAMCDIDLGSLERGVYTLEVALRNGERILERRIEEPLIVVGKLAMPEVSGDFYEQGMDLELEDVIDFTDPEDPHMWLEFDRYTAKSRRDIRAGERVTEPRIVDRDGLRFREVANEDVSAWFGYRFEFQRPHGWYLMVLEYPNDTDRAIGVGINSAVRGVQERPLHPWRTSGGGYETQAGPSITTGGKFPVDGRMHELRWLHWADPEIQIAKIVNRRRGRKAAAARLRIYRVKALPAIEILASGERDFGIHTERARSLGRTFGHSAEMGDPYQIRNDALGFDMVERFVYRLRWHWAVVENYTRYLRFTGQNTHVMGAFQYSDVNTPYTPPDRVPGDGRLLQDIRETALRVFERNGISMYSNVEYVNHKSIQTRYTASATAVGQGRDTISYVSREGELGDWRGNPNHPVVQEAYLSVADDLAEKFAFSKAWKGIQYKVYLDNGGLGPSPMSLNAAPLDYDYSDATIAAFERDTGIRTPGEPDDPNRFRLRYLFLASEEMLDTWIEWRCRNTADVLRKTLDVLHRHRPDLDVLYSYHDLPAMRYWLMESDLSYADYYRRMAMEPAQIRDNPHAWFGRTFYPTGGSRWKDSSSVAWWEQAVGRDAIEYYDGPNRLVVLDTCWDEITTVADKDIEGWPAVRFASRFIAQAHDDYCLEAFTQAMIGTDPDKLFFGFTDVNIINSREQQVREVARALTPLPKQKFEPVLDSADFRHNLSIRALREGRRTWFTVANPGYWPVRATITLSRRASVMRAYDGEPAAVREEDGRTVLDLDLRPYGLASFRASAEGLLPRAVDVESFDVAPIDEKHLAHMRDIMNDAGSMLEDQGVALAITLDDREFLRDKLASARHSLQRGQYAAAWSDLTHWRFWWLRLRLQQAKAFSARLDELPTPQSVDPTKLPALRAVRAKTPPLIDASLDDAIWSTAPVSGLFISLASGRKFEGIPLVDTAIQAAYDGNHLYLAARLADPNVEEAHTTATPEDPLAMVREHNDMLVFLLQPEGGGVRQFGVNAAGVSYAMLANGGRWPGRSTMDELSGADAWNAAVRRLDSRWVIEASIPMTSLNGTAPLADSEWKLNVIRRFRRFLVPEIYWARVRTGWGDTEHYGMLTFQ